MQSTLAFLLGIVWKKYRQQIDVFLNKRFILNLGVIFALFALTFVLGNADALSEKIRIIPKMISALSFVVIMLMISTFIKFSAFKPFGKIYFEIYVSQGFFLNLWREKVFTNVIFVILGTLLLSLLLSVSFNALNKLIRRKC